MFIVQLRYKVALLEIDKYLDAHREFLEIYYKKGIFLASGPMVPRSGGIIVVNSNDKVALQAILEQDPFYIAGIASFELLQFTPVKFRPEIATLIRG